MRMLVVCFCFKQKTAYEMRIRDWSSDVCSSDLLVVVAVGVVVAVLGVTQLVAGEQHRHALGEKQRGEKVSLLPLAQGIDVRVVGGARSEERRVGKEGVSTCRSRWSLSHYKTKQKEQMTQNSRYYYIKPTK